MKQRKNQGLRRYIERLLEQKLSPEEVKLLEEFRRQQEKLHDMQFHEQHPKYNRNPE